MKSTALYYKNNPEAAEKHRSYMRKYNKKPRNRKYRAEHVKLRRKAGIYGKGGKDMSKQADGSYKLEDPSKNRARR